MLDIDDFKRVNDVYGHGSGDQVLTDLAELLRAALRGSDVVCRLGGEEFGVIMPSGDADDAFALASRLTDTLAEVEFGPAGKITISVGISQGPEHAMNPRELVACAEAAMMTAKARGKNQIVLFHEQSSERPDGKPASGRDVRSIAHLKMLQSLAGKLNRLNDVRQIGEVIADELRLLIDYHNCRVSVIEGDEVVPIAFRGELLSRSGERVDFPRTRIGEGITGHVAETSRAAARPEHARVRVRGDDPRDAHDRGVADRRAALLRRARDRRRRDLEARRRPVRRGRRAPARGAGRPGVGRARERPPVRGPAARGRPPEGAARVHGRDLRGGHARRDRRGDRARGSADPRWQEVRALAPGRERRLQDQRALGLRRRARRCSRCSTSCFPPTALRSRDRRANRAVPGRGRGGRRRCAPPPEGLTWPDLALAPLRNDGALEGFISVREPTTDSEHTVEEILRLLGGISYQAAVALERARSYESLEETFVSTVEALANALEANDEYTSSHTRWITDMALRVGEAMGFEPVELKRLELGALFHDIGKIGIPTSILLKPGPLSAEERAIMEMHPELGERILEPIDRLAEVRTIVRSCHERWDGAGYPDRKAGEEIPLEARIILVCDAFHAMTTDRPYRKRLSCEEACRRLREGAGTQFDPNVVDVFLGLPLEVPVPHDAADERLAS